MTTLRALFLFATTLGAAVLPAQQTPGKLRVVDLHGTPFERGLQHGKALAAEIRGLVGAFEQDLAKTGGQPAGEFVQHFLQQTRYDAAIRRYTPRLLDEVRGLAEDAGQPFDTMLVYQLSRPGRRTRRRSRRCGSSRVADPDQAGQPHGPAE